MTFEAKLILSSVADGVELHTFQLKYWRAIHSEVMTHRVFSRNAGSSRAIPVEKMLTQIRDNPAGPTHWGKNEKGMQASQENDELVKIPESLYQAYNQFKLNEDFVLNGVELLVCKETAWRFSAWLAASMSGAFSEAGYHKQVANRITEPYQFINVILSSTEWGNFFNLRRHSDAMPEFKDIADEMYDLIAKSHPQELNAGEWHIPFIGEDELSLSTESKLKLSTARCASVSYKTVEGSDMTEDTANRIFDKLVGSNPIHASPTEHQAQVCYGMPRLSDFESNFRLPWLQYRKFVENSVIIED